MIIADRIQQIRKDHGLTQKQLAEKIGCMRQAVCQWETGRRNPKLSSLEKLACVFGVSVNDLIRDEVAEQLTQKSTQAELTIECKDVDSDIGRERGWRDVWYRCPGCGVGIATESWDRVYCFGSGSIMKDNHIPAFCPECGQKIVKKRWKP